jgi:hypothetical protein
MDLLTAVTHELGHVIGLQDWDSKYTCMAAELNMGERHMPVTDDIKSFMQRMTQWRCWSITDHTSRSQDIIAQSPTWPKRLLNDADSIMQDLQLAMVRK